MKKLADLGFVKLESAYDGTSGWMKRTNIVEQKGADLERLKRSALFQPLLSYTSSGVRVQAKGKETIQETEVFVVEFLPEGGSPEKFYFDTQTGLLIREIRTLPQQQGDKTDELVIDYGDYREVDGVKLPYSIIETRPGQIQSLKLESYSLNMPLEDHLFENPMAKYAGEPYEVGISTIPRHIYKENDGLFEAASTESFYFFIVVKEKYNRPIDPISSSIQFFTGKDPIQSIEFSRSALNAIRKASLGTFANQQEIFYLTHSFSIPVQSEVDRLMYTLKLQRPDGEIQEKQLEIPIENYHQKAKLIFPIKGNFIVAGAHDYNEPHSGEWSQHYAYDVIGLGPDFQLIKNNGKTNADYWTWGREILAPADGTVLYARKDVRDNEQPGKIETGVFMSLPDPMWAVGGNNVVIDHGNGEFSFLAHLQQGSVRVQQGDFVRRGDIIGLLGNSGNSDAPHLHYHLMACQTIFQCDGLPSQFENVYDFFTGQKLKAPFLKRGLFLEAK
jgi:hypothetical protein